MASVNLTYATAATLTVTGLATLANAASAVSGTVDNTTNLYMDALVEVIVDTGSGATASGYVEVWVKGSIDNVDFDDDPNDKWIGSVTLVVAGADTRKRVMSVAAAFGGVMPPYWQIRIRNVSGAALTAGSVAYRGVKLQTV